MKKYILLLLVSFFTLNCDKDDDEDCNCGIITDDEITDDDCYSLSIRNDCSDNIETFCFTEDIWMDNYVGGDFCVTNVDSW